MQILKGIVIFMSVVLVVGFTALIIMWQDKRKDSTVGSGESTVVAEVPVTVTPLGDTTVALPAGARVIQTDSAGNVVDVLVQNADGSHDLYQVSRADGDLLGIIRFRHEAE